MGRSYLSIKLAAVFGLLVAGAVTAQQHMAQAEGPEAVEERAHVAKECDEALNVLVRTPRATAPSAPSVRAARS